MRKVNDPFVKRSTLRFLTRGETPSVRAVALQLHFGMVKALADGSGAIHASWKEIADWAGVSERSVRRAVERLRELGWVKELVGHRIVFDYRRSLPQPEPAEKCQFGRDSYKELETLREGGETSLPTPADPQPPSGADECSSAEPKKKSASGAAIAALVAAGVDRAGAVRSVRLGRGVTPERVQELARIIRALPVRPMRPAGLLCAAVARPELGAKLIRDHRRTAPPVCPESRMQTGRASAPPDAGRLVRGWLDFAAGMEGGREWIIRQAERVGIGRAGLRAAGVSWA